jgi:hypothetical protein
MEPGRSLPHLQEPATCPYLEPAQFSPCPHSNVFKINFNIILPSTSGSPKWSPSLRSPHQNPACSSLSPQLNRDTNAGSRGRVHLFHVHRVPKYSVSDFVSPSEYIFIRRCEEAVPVPVRTCHFAFALRPIFVTKPEYNIGNKDACKI